MSVTNNNNKTITGFSKLSKRAKIKWIVNNFFRDPEIVMKELMSYWHIDDEQQEILDGFSENTISNYHMPYSVAPNFLINGESYVIPMVIEESSVVAAAASAAKFWMDRGGFKTTILGTEKIGQVHFTWQGKLDQLRKMEDQLIQNLIDGCSDITANMVGRGGGIRNIVFELKPEIQSDFFQLIANFETCDSMGANFINSCLERFAVILNEELSPYGEFDTIMSILSNYTPKCLVRAEVKCKIDDLGQFTNGMSPHQFSEKFKLAVDIAKHDPYRATTHNKGIFNGIDAVALATGNDFRAIEACAHTYASKSGKYRSLSECTIVDGIFHFWMDLPLAIGTVGGLTSLHPIAKRSLELLNFPDSSQLMQVIAATGLAQNFAAVKSLITTGIQKGHMKMHLRNILHQLNATKKQTEDSLEYFSDKVVTHSAVRSYLKK